MTGGSAALAGGDRDLDLRELAQRLWQGRSWIALSVVVFTGALAAVALLMQPIYRATITLAPAQTDDSAPGDSALGSLGGLAALAGVLGDTRTQESLAVLKSREFTEQFITERQLLPLLYASLYDADKRAWKVAADRQPTLARAYKYFEQIRMAAIDQKTGLVKLQIDWRDPQQAAAWANELVARLNQLLRQRAIERSTGNIGYLQRELQTTPEVATRAAIGRLLEAQIRERMLASVSQEYAFRVIDRALVPDVHDPLRPKKLLLVVLGVVVGLFVGISGVFVHGATRPAE